MIAGLIILGLMRVLLTINAIKKKFNADDSEVTATAEMRDMIGEQGYEALVGAVFIVELTCFIGLFYYGSYRLLTPDFGLIGQIALAFGLIMLIADVIDFPKLIDTKKSDILFKNRQYDNIHKTKRWFVRIITLVLNLVVDLTIIWALTQVF